MPIKFLASAYWNDKKIIVTAALAMFVSYFNIFLENVIKLTMDSNLKMA